MASKRPSKPSERSSSPLDEKRKALAEHERKINEAIERRKRLIEEAPKLKQEQAKQRRDELLHRKSRIETGANPRGALHDKRHVIDVNASARDARSPAYLKKLTGTLGAEPAIAAALASLAPN